MMARKTLTNKQKAFVAEYLKDFNATQAAIRAGYSPKSARLAGHNNITNHNIAEMIKAEIDQRLMSVDEAHTKLARRARFDISPFHDGYRLDYEAMKAAGFGDLLREFRISKDSIVYKWADPDDALKEIVRIHEKAKLPTGKEDDPIHTRGTIFIDYGLDNDDSV